MITIDEWRMGFGPASDVRRKEHRQWETFVKMDERLLHEHLVFVRLLGGERIGRARRLLGCS